MKLPKIGAEHWKAGTLHATNIWLRTGRTVITINLVTKKKPTQKKLAEFTRQALKRAL